MPASFELGWSAGPVRSSSPNIILIRLEKAIVARASISVYSVWSVARAPFMALLETFSECSGGDGGDPAAEGRVAGLRR